MCQWKGLVGDGTNKNNQNGRDRGEDWAIDEIFKSSCRNQINFWPAQPL